MAAGPSSAGRAREEGTRAQLPPWLCVAAASSMLSWVKKKAFLCGIRVRTVLGFFFFPSPENSEEEKQKLGRNVSDVTLFQLFNILGAIYSHSPNGVCLENSGESADLTFASRCIKDGIQEQ